MGLGMGSPLGEMLAAGRVEELLVLGTTEWDHLQVSGRRGGLMLLRCQEFVITHQHLCDIDEVGFTHTM